MSNLFWLTDAQMTRLQPFFRRSHGKPRVDDRRARSGTIFINRNGLRCCDAPKEYGPPKILYNRWKRWSDKGGLRPDDVKSVYVFDHRGNPVETRHFVPDGLPDRNSDGYAREVTTFDSRGQVVEQAYFDIEGKPVSSSLGFARSTAKHDLRGNMIEQH